MEFDFNGKAYLTDYWNAKYGKLGNLVALDTETELAQPDRPPGYVIGSAYGGGDTAFLVTQNSLRDFMEVHRDCTFIMHTAAFDTTVITSETGFDFDLMIRSNRLWDISIEHRLFALAQTGAIPENGFRLSELAQIYLGFSLNKAAHLRENWGRYRVAGSVNYHAIGNEEIVYAATDAIATWQIFQSLHPKVIALSPKHFLSHKIQLMGELALKHVSLNGMSVDLDERAKFLSEQESKIEAAQRMLQAEGCFPNQKGIRNQVQDKLRSLGLDIPLTKTGLLATDKKTLKKFRSDSSFIDTLLTFNKERTIRSMIEKLNQERIHPNFNGIVNTGRTSSRNPNFQNLPKDERVRRIFIPKKGFLFVIADYKQLELCTLAQVCIDRYGYSKMGELINAGVDLHRWFAGVVTGKDLKDVTDFERQAAKACNFGFPGGLQARGFIAHAEQTYGISGITLPQAEEYREKWIQAFPEMDSYLQEELLLLHDFSSLEWCESPVMAIAIFKRIISGNPFKNDGQPYADSTIRWAFETVLPDLAPQMKGITQGSPEIATALFDSPVVTRTGRIRGHPDYGARRNTPFQGLAADGAKISLYRLIREGFRVVNFVHDENVIEVPMDGFPEDDREKIVRIMEQGMAAVVPNVRIQVSSGIAEWWKKPD